MSKKAYTIRAAFYSPIVFYDRPMLDGIISRALYLQDRGRGFSCYRTGSIGPKHPGENRLVKLLGTIDGLHLASAMQTDLEPIDFLDSWKKRFDAKYAKLADFGRGARKVNTSSGKYRSYNMPLPAKCISSAWWAFIGCGPRVLDLLQEHVVSVGKKCSEGFGWVESWTIERSNFSATQVLRMRPVPVDRAAALGLRGLDNQRFMAWKSPYWATGNVVACRCPEDWRENRA